MKTFGPLTKGCPLGLLGSVFLPVWYTSDPTPYVLMRIWPVILGTIIGLIVDVALRYRTGNAVAESSPRANVPEG